ncbi:MAG TPA: hypothetical protein VEW07_02085 [Solirubrobacterales bacterium]|nr:hypothetical protein [Solirubrobacterales bacterium]
MIAARRRRIDPVFSKLAKRWARWSRRVDRAANRALERIHPILARGAHQTRTLAKRTGAVVGPRLRPLGVVLFRAIARGEAWVRAGSAAALRGATRASAVVTPRRAIGFAIAAAGGCLIASQFLDYRAVEIGQSGYAGFGSVARPPTVDVRTAGDAHAYLLVPLGLIAIALGAFAAARERRRLGLAVAALGLAAIAVILLVDLPNGLDAGAQTSRFAGAEAVLEDGFYAELAAAAGLVVAGLLYYARPCRIRTNSSGRAASARRRRPRPPASSPARVARRA